MKTTVYVANADSHDISVLALDAASGALDEVERFPAGGVVMPLAASPEGRVLHASLRSEPYSVLSLAIEPSSGRLSEIGRAALPASMCWLSMDHGGRFLLSAGYHANVVAVSPIGPDGAALEAQQVVPTELNAHSVQVDPSNRFAFAACLGGGLVRQMRFDAATGHLSDNEPRAWIGRPGAGPRHFVFHPRAPFLDLLNELDAGLDVLAFDAQRGQLRTLQTVSTMPPGF
ncbi:MAG: beta-propeller fold lactonase family protein, partial [Caldimonas sp.]